MAWNPAPEVAAARDFGKKFDAPCVLILYVKSDGSVNGASYGKTRNLCDAMGDVLDDMLPEFQSAVYDLVPDSAA